MTAVLEVSNLRKAFGGVIAVDGVSFEVRQGEILGIIGPNGSGKSTLFNCVLGQLQPSAGEVRIDGQVTTGARPVRPQPSRRQPDRFSCCRFFRSFRCATTSSSLARSTRARWHRASSAAPMPGLVTPPRR
jgi:ABC-type branched-subunit amino acid transport system ATPase component